MIIIIIRFIVVQVVRMCSYPRKVTNESLRKPSTKRGQDFVNVATQDMTTLERYGVLHTLYISFTDTLCSMRSFILVYQRVPKSVHPTLGSEIGDEQTLFY